MQPNELTTTYKKRKSPLKVGFFGFMFIKHFVS